MDGLLSWLGLQKAGGKDIELPNESGRVDPRILAWRRQHQLPDVGGALKKAGEGYKHLMKTSEQLKKKPEKKEEDD